MTSPTQAAQPDRLGTRALWFTSPRVAEVREESLPDPGEGEVLVRALVSLVSAGTEMNVYRGQISSWDEVAARAVGTFPFPIKFAYQTIGEIEEAGARSPYAVGERVFIRRPHQERSVVAAEDPATSRDIHPVPRDLDPRRAIFANLFTVAFNTLLDAPARIGDVVAVSGLGVIGTFAAQLARLTAGRLILVDPLPGRLERAAWIGADAAVSPDDAVEAIMGLSDGRGADLYIEASGATPALQTGIDATGAEGAVAVLSYYGNREAVLRLSPEFHLRRQRIISCFVGAASVGSGLQPRWTSGRRVATAFERLRDIDTERLISHTVPFVEAPSAYRLIDERPQETLGVILDYGNQT